MNRKVVAIGNHPFLDRNKRTAITAAGLFLMLNSCELKTAQNELECFTVEMALRKKNRKDGVEWFRSHSVRRRT